MAVLCSRASGNFTAAATWGVVDATTFTDTETNVHVISTSLLTFVSHVPGAITLSGIAIKVANRAASPAGTFTLTLRNVTDAVDVTSVTINVSDLPAVITQGNSGWHFFKFSSNQTLIAGKAYALRVQCSNTGSQVSIYANSGTVGSATVAQMWVTTTTGAPAANDQFHVMGEYTGAGTGNTITVTQNNTATTIFGNSSISQTAAQFTLNSKGVLTSGVASATNYVLRLRSVLRTYPNSMLILGDSGAEIPRDSTSFIEFDNITDGDYGYYMTGGTIKLYGLSRTSGKDIDRCYLNTDEAVGQTVLGVDTDTGWLNGDDIAIAPTARTLAQYERRTLSGGAGASSVTVSAGLTYAHSGTAPTQAEVALLTRNVGIRSVSSTSAYGVVSPESTLIASWASFRYLGTGTAGKTAAILCQTTTAGGGSLSLTKCSIYDCKNNGFQVTATTANNFTLESCVSANCNSSSTGGGFVSITANLTGTNFTINNCWYLGETATNGTAFSLTDEGGVITNLVATGVNAGFVLNNSFSQGQIGTVSDLTGHTCNYAFAFSGSRQDCTYTRLKAWRCITQGGFYISSLEARRVVFDSFEAFGNTNYNFQFTTTSVIEELKFVGCSGNGDTSFATTTNININSRYVDFEMENCDWSVVSGIKTACTNDILIANPGVFQYVTKGRIFSSNLGAATEISGMSTADNESYISIQKKDKTSGLHETHRRYGKLSIDTGTYKTASPSMRMTPNSASFKLESATRRTGMKVAVSSGGTITANIWVYKHASYNGAQPRLIARKNYAAGVISDTVLDTMSGGTGAWEQLSGTTVSVSDDAVLEFIVDCDGTAGYIFIDDWTFS